MWQSATCSETYLGLQVVLRIRLKNGPTVLQGQKSSPLRRSIRLWTEWATLTPGPGRGSNGAKSSLPCRRLGTPFLTLKMQFRPSGTL